MPRVAVLYHELDRNAAEHPYRIRKIAKHWRDWGIDVDFHLGIRKRFEADLVLPHIDLTRRPDDYQAFLESYPRVVNRNVVDISKRMISSHLVGPDSDWSGPVIVKTDLNFGGWSEQRILKGARLPKRPRGWRRLFRRPPSWKSIEWMWTTDYRVFPALQKVPPAVFENRALVVEKFLPERDGELYCCRNYMFCGSEGYGRLRAGRDPAVKAETLNKGPEVPIPAVVMEVRKRLGLDYGKIDFVIHDGKPVILDVNKTQGGGLHTQDPTNKTPLLARGIRMWFPDLRIEEPPRPETV